MSEFADIKRAYDAYSTSGSWANVNYGLIYTCNAGWLDLGHLNPYNKRALIGAANLWASVKNGGVPALRRNCTFDGQARSFEYGGLIGYWYNQRSCKNEPYFLFPDNQKGYLVRYRQDHGGIPGKLGVERHYVVKIGLTQAQKKSVALSIFMDVSHGFERLQKNLGMWDLFTDSGYSQEDLVSNLIGFYIAVGELTKEEAIRIAHPVSQTSAESIWKRNGSVGSHKNREFKPDLLETHRNDPKLQICIDECLAQPRKFPKELQTIRPAKEGQLFQQVRGGSALKF